MTQILGYAAHGAHSELKAMHIHRAPAAPNEVEIEILYCGVCHSDVHQAKNEWKNTIYPCMPGHEIVGRVRAVGADVAKFQIGDLVGVGCMVDSCHHCEACEEGLEQYCEEGFLATYNGNMRKPTEQNHTYGGYSESMNVREDFVLRIPDALDPRSAGPILCAGVTTYSPLKHWGVGPGSKVGVVGLGGLGHMAIKIAKALGAEVTAVTSSPEKVEDARKFGATHVILSTDEGAMKQHARSLDFILNIIPQPHDVNPFMPLLKRDGTLTVVGCIAPLTKPLDLSTVLIDRKSLGTSLIGSIAETQEVLDFCATHQIAPTIEVIDIDQINQAFETLDKGEMGHRYVIDMASLQGKKAEKPGIVDKVLDLVP